MADSSRTEDERAPLVELKRLTKRFPGVTALDDVTFDIRPGEVHGLVGENGAGKSTLIKILSGVYRPDEGQLLIRGEPVNLRSPSQAQDQGITTIHQERTLAPDLDPLSNIFLGREPLRRGIAALAGVVDRRTMLSRAEAIAAEFGLTRRDLLQSVNALGPLQQQIVELLKALVFESALVVMDEPSAALTDSERHALFERIEALKSRGVAILLVTHHLDEIMEQADRATVLRDGKFVATVRPSESSYNDLLGLMVGTELASLEELSRRSSRTAADQPDQEPVIRADHLSYRRALQDVSIVVAPGEVLGIAGLAGAGRTELAHALIGAITVDEGQTWLRGEPTKFHSPADAYRAGIAFVPSDRKIQGIFGELTLAENVTASNLPRIARGRTFLRRSHERDVATGYVSELDIRTPSVGQQIRYLSGGNQQKGIIARAFFSDPAVIVFDEPMQGIDVGAKVEVARVIDAFAESGGAAIVISSEIPELRSISNRIAIMRQGRIVGELPGGRSTSDGQGASEEEIMAYATGARAGHV